jgi:hypothetical protein
LRRFATEWWDRFWFEEIPADIFSLLRILFGLAGLFGLVGLLDVPLFWSCDGLVASRGDSLCQSIGNLYPYLILCFVITSFAAMAVGFSTRLAVACSFWSVFLLASWNDLPLSAAHQVLRAVLFCLVWADSGRRWSLDAWLNRRSGPTDASTQNGVPIWPLRLLQIQVATVYLVTALWKVNNLMWRDGSALHYIFENPQFPRFSVFASPVWDSWMTLATYATLAWELSFAFLLLHPRTRRWTLALGIVIHLGMWATMELGPFSWIMLASYVAFVDPRSVSRWLSHSPAVSPLATVRTEL